MREVPSFDVINELINGKQGAWSKASGVLKNALKIAPGLLLGGLNIDLASIVIHEQKIDVNSIIDNILNGWETVSLFAGQRKTDFQHKYDQFRLANTWLILAAYFDTIRIHHKELWSAIDLQPDEVDWLSEEVRKSYDVAQEIFGEDGRGVLYMTQNGMGKLEEYYRLLNKSTALFAEGLEEAVHMRADWDKYPLIAVQCYKKEMIALCGKSSEFFAWTDLSSLVEILNSIDEIRESQGELIALVKALLHNPSNIVPANIKEEFFGKYAYRENMQGCVLDDREIKMVCDFSEKIDVEDTNLILQFGAGTQKKMADFSDASLSNVRMQDLGDVGDLIVDVVGVLKGFDADEDRGFFGFFRKQADKLETMKAKFAKAEVNVARISKALESHQIRLMKESAMFDQMYKQNLAYFKELTMYILAGKQKLAEVRSGKLRELQATAQRTGLAEDAQKARDLSDKCDRFEKKIYDLDMTRFISIQTASQIRMLQNNDTVMVEKIQTTLMNTIPLWKNQMVISLSVAHSTEAASAQRQVTDITNALLKQNAERLHMASVETAKEAERGIVDIETLKQTNAKLIQTFDDVMKIQADGRAKRLAAEAEMVKMENDLKTKLLQIRNGN